MDLFIYRALTPDLNKALTREVTAALGARKRFDPEDTQAVQVWDTTDMFVFFDAFMMGFNIFLGLMGALTLVVGGIGVSNIMYAVVKEKTHEIGVQMALGAHRSRITWPFVLQGVAYTLLGGVFGVVIAVTLVSLIALIGP